MTTDVGTSLDHTWTMVAGFLVMFMQAGFAMVEAGSVSAKNSQGILMKNLLDACIGAIAWFALGYGFAFGGDAEDKGKFIGTSLFFGQHKDYNNAHYVSWFFQWAFCATAATIVSGAMAERVRLLGYAVFMVIMTAFVYPVIVHWTWGGGWLSDGDAGIYKDFAGSGIVHMTGGVAALCGAAIIGPRTGRFDAETSSNFVPHSIPLVVLGTFVLWFGWYGFNCGSTVSMTDGNDNTAALIAMTTTLSGAMSGIVVFFGRLMTSQQHDVCGLANGILAGLVSVTAGCDGVYGWAAIIIGAVGGLIFLGTSALLKKLKVDDPVDAFAVHGACGAWGVVAVAFFNFTSGIFYGGEDAGKLLQWQILGIVCIALWTAVLSSITFFSLKKLGMLRLSLAEEEAGADAHAPFKAYRTSSRVFDRTKSQDKGSDPELQPVPAQA